MPQPSPNKEKLREEFRKFAVPQLWNDEEIADSVFNWFDRRFTSHRQAELEEILGEIEEGTKWATTISEENEDSNWKIHYGGYREAIKDVVEIISNKIQKK